MAHIAIQIAKLLGEEDVPSEWMFSLRYINEEHWEYFKKHHLFGVHRQIYHDSLKRY
jgi:hypothetical protein